MKLTERYRRLTFWNKLSALGALASILSIPLAVVLFLLSDGAGNGDGIPTDAGRYAVANRGDTVASAGSVAVAGEGAMRPQTPRPAPAHSSTPRQRTVIEAQD
jgi:hypothetical protein